MFLKLSLFHDHLIIGLQVLKSVMEKPEKILFFSICFSCNTSKGREEKWKGERRFSHVLFALQAGSSVPSLPFTVTLQSATSLLSSQSPTASSYSQDPWFNSSFSSNTVVYLQHRHFRRQSWFDWLWFEKSWHLSSLMGSWKPTGGIKIIFNGVIWIS